LAASSGTSMRGLSPVSSLVQGAGALSQRTNRYLRRHRTASHGEALVGRQTSYMFLAPVPPTVTVLQ
jgi:hypothetical protein